VVGDGSTPLTTTTTSINFEAVLPKQGGFFMHDTYSANRCGELCLPLRLSFGSLVRQLPVVVCFHQPQIVDFFTTVRRGEAQGNSPRRIHGVAQRFLVENFLQLTNILLASLHTQVL